MYNLAEDCADRYYTKVIKTLTHLLKSSFHERQLVLVNTTQAHKFLESYAARQTKLWKVLSKYHHLLDQFHDLQTNLQTKFSLLKKATSQNIENLQEAITLQQNYTSAICGHVNSIYIKLAQLDRQVQTQCLYPHPQSDVVQINAPEYNSDIDGQTELLPDIQLSTSIHTASIAEDPSNAKHIQEDTVSVAANSEEHTASLQNCNRPESQFPPVPDEQTIQYTKTLNNPGKNIPITTDQNWKIFQN